MLVDTRALHWAVQLRNLEAMEILLKNRADASISDLNGLSPLSSAAHLQNYEAVSMLLRNKKANKVDVNISNVGGSTALHHACREDNVGLAKLLIEHGADVNARCAGGWTALHRAATGNEELLRLLLDNGAAIDAGRECGDAYVSSELVVHQTDFGNVVSSNQPDGSWTPLQEAVNSESYATARTLLRRGCRPELTFSKWGSTLHYLAIRQDVELTKLMYEAGELRGMSFDAKDEEGNTANKYMYHQRNASTEMIKAYTSLERKIREVNNGSLEESFEQICNKRRQSVEVQTDPALEKIHVRIGRIALGCFYLGICILWIIFYSMLCAIDVMLYMIIW